MLRVGTRTQGSTCGQAVATLGFWVLHVVTVSLHLSEELLTPSGRSSLCGQGVKGVSWEHGSAGSDAGHVVLWWLWPLGPSGSEAQEVGEAGVSWLLCFLLL